MEVQPYLIARQKVIDQALDRHLPKASVKPPTIHKAMRYSLFAGEQVQQGGLADIGAADESELRQ